MYSQNLLEKREYVMNTPVDLTQLEPQNVWTHFATLCQIPRQSKHEQQLRQHLQNWAIAKGLETYSQTA